LAAIAISLAASIAEPPPKATIASQSFSLKNSRPSSISGIGASGVMRSKTT
jgi:hypothetical protein